MSRLTLARIKSRCTEDGDCLLWTGSVHNRHGSPTATEYLDGKDCYVAVRRRAYEEYHGVKLTKADQIATCGNPRCLAKAHLECITVSEKGRRMHANMDAATRQKRGKAISEVMRQAKGKVLPEQVEAIRDSEDGPYVTAQRLGINGVVASRIKRGTAYKTYEASPFSGLFGANKVRTTATNSAI